MEIYTYHKNNHRNVTQLFKKVAEHGDIEHDEIKKSLEKLREISPKETTKWWEQLGELRHTIEHHYSHFRYLKYL